MCRLRVVVAAALLASAASGTYVCWDDQGSHMGFTDGVVGDVLVDGHDTPFTCTHVDATHTHSAGAEDDPVERRPNLYICSDGTGDQVWCGVMPGFAVMAT